ncbi:MAG TPA: DUF4258 domain-containing protein [Candidatus Aquilonibacter sp.]|nr:DUF4258 domain-containing protein [Candidatus Aquilonibacter sp.]
MEKKEFAELLQGVSYEITFSEHFFEKAKARNIRQEDVIRQVKSLEQLVEIADQGDDPRGHKYGLLFKTGLSNYDLKVVISLRSKSLNIITAHLQNVRKRKGYRKWLES